MPSNRRNNPALYMKRQLAVVMILVGSLMTLICLAVGKYNGAMLLGVALAFFGLVAVYALTGRKL